MSCSPCDHHRHHHNHRHYHHPHHHNHRHYQCHLESRPAEVSCSLFHFHHHHYAKAALRAARPSGIVVQGCSRKNHEKPIYFLLSTFYFLLSTFYFLLSTFKEVRINRTNRQTDRPFKEVMIFCYTQTLHHNIYITILWI